MYYQVWLEHNPCKKTLGETKKKKNLDVNGFTEQVIFYIKE